MTKKTATKSSINELSAESRLLHARLKKEWNIRDGAGGITLLTLCQCVDRLREAQQLLKRDGIVTMDRWGQIKSHPACTVEREARAGLFQALKALGLDLESLEPEDA
jgi:P27 family predicted phage terminase small subunit